MGCGCRDGPGEQLGAAANQLGRGIFDQVRDAGRPRLPRRDLRAPRARLGANGRRAAQARPAARSLRPTRNTPRTRWILQASHRRAPMPEIHLIPLAEIDEAALTRDRTAPDEAALTELRSSIAVSGLRMPIEVFELDEPDGPHRYGLISGFRRLAAVRALAEIAYDKARYQAIPAFIREPKSAEDVYVQMVEENAIRAEVSPWEQAMVAVKSARAEVLRRHRRRHRRPLLEPQPHEAHPAARHRPPRRRPRRPPDRPRDPEPAPAPAPRPADPPRLRRPDPRHPVGTRPLRPPNRSGRRSCRSSSKPSAPNPSRPRPLAPAAPAACCTSPAGA